MTQAHPLQWPHGRPRTKQRRDSAFKVTPAKALEEMMDELKRFGAKNAVVSSNIPTRLDGLKELLPDPGVARGKTSAPLARRPKDLQAAILELADEGEFE